MKVEPESVTGGDGYRVTITEEEAERINMHVLSQTSQNAIETMKNHFIVPKEQRLEMLFFRQIFTCLRQQVHMHNLDALMLQQNIVNDENIPIEEFQRAFERLFFVLKDPQGFDAKVYDQNRNGFVGWGEFCFVFKKRKIKIILSLSERIFLTFDDPDSSYLSQIVSMIVLLTIVTSSLCFILSTTPENAFMVEPESGEAPLARPFFKNIERVCLILFIAEYFVRLCTCWGVRAEVFDRMKLLQLTAGFDAIRLPAPPWWLAWVPFDLPGPVIKTLKFMFGPANILDFFAILPGIIGYVVKNVDGGGFVVLRLVRLTRVFRTINSIKRPSIVIARTISQSTKALYVLGFNLGLGIVISGSLMYLAEGGTWDPETRSYLRPVTWDWNATSQDWMVIKEPSPFLSIPHAFWWSIVTATTVGYGDMFPTTSLGYIVTVAFMVFSLVILALPIGVIGENFMKQWEEFEKEKQGMEAARRREMTSITSAIQRIEPEQMTRILFIQVWNERFPESQQAWGTGRDGRPMTRRLPAEFMGFAEVQLELSIDKTVTRQQTVHLKPDFEIVNRQITGTLTFEYEWVPRKKMSTAEESRMSRERSASSHDEQLLPDPALLFFGTLRINLAKADNLVNLDLHEAHSASNPFVTFTCYPCAPREANDFVWPAVWRAPTRQNSLHPKWSVSHCFEFDWTNLQVVGLDGPDEMPKASEVEEITSTADTKIVRISSKDGSSQKLEAALTLLQDFRKSVGKAREQIQVLRGRVDEYSMNASKKQC
mmetsp:Transcript_71962/g.153884  ORF Transcript_71962/g.153884 Transcript_71962/m.153884 type:complete len:768 (-) Transcript_71962:81-2384(-)